MRGLALIVVIGVLGVLSVLAVAFVTMAQLERKASQQRVNAERAYLLAKSGIEDALARLGMGQDPDAFGNRYLGEDWNADGVLNAGPEFDGQVYHPTPVGSVPDTDACPVRYAMRPSFFLSVLGNPRLVSVDGRQRGYTGRLAGDYVTEGNQYALKVQEQGFYVNGGDPSASSFSGYNAVLRGILGTLADAIDQDLQPDGTPAPRDGIPVGQADGWALIDRRPGTGWQSFTQIRDVALGGSQAKLDALKPYLTLHAWADKHVIHPNATDGTGGSVNMVGRECHSWAQIKLDRPLNPSAPGMRSPDFERIPRAGGRIVGRSPVDFSWVRTRRPALIALMAGLKGLYLNEWESTPITSRLFDTGDLIGVLSPATITLDWTQPMDDCRTAVSAILTSTSALGTWQDFDAFCDTIPFTATSSSPEATSDLRQAMRDILKANFNPNSDLNKFGPNPSLHKMVDKSDLLVYSTEFSLFDVQGQQVSVIGRVLNAQGRLLASRTLSATVGGPSVVRLSTQRDFVDDENGVPRLPGAVPYISPYKGPGGSGTWGQALAGISPGLSLQSYPEPCVNPGGGLAINPADYDGRLELATFETPKDDWYGVAAPTKEMKMLARFTDRFDLDVAGGAAAVQTAASLVTTGELGNSLMHATKPNTLYPDGAYAEGGYAPSYFDKLNANGFHGVMSFWIKPNYAMTRQALYVASSASYASRGHSWVGWSNSPHPGGASDSANQLFILGDFRYPWARSSPRWLACQFELGHANSDVDQEMRFRIPDRRLQPHLWHLITFYYDLRAFPDADRCGELLVDAGLGGSARSFYNDYDNRSDRRLASDLTQDVTDPVTGVTRPHRIVLGLPPTLGGDYMVYETAGAGADATFDEFVIYDFGGAGRRGVADPNTAASPGILAGGASGRYKEGRYYRESVYPNDPLRPDDFPGNPTLFPGNTAAQWFSAPISLGAATIQALSWTQIVPRGLRAPLPATAPDGGPAQAGWDGDDGPDGQIVFDLADTSGNFYAKDASGQTINTLFTQDAMSLVKRNVNAPFRLHAVFQPNLADPANTPILDPLALDDVTILYQPVSGPGISSWQEGE